MEKEKIIKFLIKSPVIFFILLLLFLTFLNVKIENLLIVVILLSIVCFFYFFIFYFLIKNKKIKFFKRIDNVQFYTYQLKIVLLEEFLWRFLPYKIFIYLFGNSHINLFIIVLTFIFTISHFFKKDIIYVLIFIEFFLFFYLTNLLFIYFSNFLVLFLPHFYRNIIIQYMKFLK